MSTSELLTLLPEGVFEELALETRVDHQVKKLSGEVVFKLLLFSMLSSERLSLRVMESFLASARFTSLVGTKGVRSRYSSLSDRISSIPSEYFEKLFEKVFASCNKLLKEEGAVSKVDSTLVALSAKLFAHGMTTGGGEAKRFVKYTIRMKGSLPASAKSFTDQAYVSEELAMGELIEGAAGLAGEVVVFDRGLQSRNRFDRFSREGKFFITRVNATTRFRVSESRAVDEQPVGSTVTIASDELGLLVNKQNQWSQSSYRLITARTDAGEDIRFLTNLMEEDAYGVARWYKERWEIELFFKFLKQHLNLKHLVSRSENGIKVMLYMTLITATLILVYKKLNRVKGFKLAKQRFTVELENETIRQIVLLCGGDPAQAAHLWNTS